MTIADEEFTLDGKPITISKILPDKYTLTLNGKNTYFDSEGTVQSTGTVFSESATISLSNTSYSIGFEGKSADSIVYVNGKSTDKSIQDIGIIEPVFGNKATFHAVRTIADGKRKNLKRLTGSPEIPLLSLFRR